MPDNPIYGIYGADNFINATITSNTEESEGGVVVTYHRETVLRTPDCEQFRTI